MKLFQIYDTHTRSRVPNLYFSDKKQAKTKRRELNGGEETRDIRYVVTPGPEHKNYKP